MTRPLHALRGETVPQPTQTLQALHDWAFRTALPFWIEAGPDRVAGGFHEQLDFAGRPAPCGFRRLRVTARQVYVFCHAAVLGHAGGLATAGEALDLMWEKAWQGPDRGWARLLDDSNQVLDPTADLYDCAFMVFAHAWHHRATGDARSLARADATLDFIEQQMGHPSGGFQNLWPAADGPRLQNPHMHLVEALLALVEATGGDRYRELALTLIDLIRTRVIDRATGTLGERFTRDWQFWPGADGAIREPGHQFEWVWILDKARQLLGVDITSDARLLYASASRLGINQQTGLVCNAIDPVGNRLDGGSRSWTNTERLKAEVVAGRLFGLDTAAGIEATGRVLLDRYLAAPVPGTYIDAFDAAGAPIAKAVPASILYHLFLAICEATSAHNEACSFQGSQKVLGPLRFTLGQHQHAVGGRHHDQVAHAVHGHGEAITNHQTA